MDPVIVKNVDKYYKKYSNKHKYLTLKSALINRTLFSDLQANEKFQALKNINLNIKKGETISFIGENGSGKSTLLKLLAGISKPTSGEIITDGRISALIELGAGFHPEISGRENIFINGIILGLTKKKIEEKLDDIIKFAELEEFIDNPVKSYSSGMYMRLGFSIAINVDPDILLIDEVLAVGDASFVPKCLDKINEFKRRGKTIIFVSHDLSTVARISDRVFWIKDGEIFKHGYPKEIVDSYLQFIGVKDAKKAIEEHTKQVQKAKDENETVKEEVPEIKEEEPSILTSKRWGNREISIEDVKMIDKNGKEKYIYKSKEPFSIEFKIKANKPQKDFVFGMGIFSPEGIHCYGTNTDIEEFKSKTFSGEGIVRIDIPDANLINGKYFLDVAVHKWDGYPFDYHHFLYTFNVTSKFKDFGITRMTTNWNFSDNIKIDKKKQK